MSALKHADSFRDLIVYEKGCRSSRSIGANLAEAWAKRRYEKHFISKLTDADGEQMETQHWTETALENGYIDQKTWASLMEKCLEFGRMLNGMMDKAEMFCGEPPRTVREDLVVYITDSGDKDPDD